MSSDASYTLWGWILWFVVGLVFAFICASIARRKGYPSLLFGILGFFFSCVVLIIVLLIPRRNTTV